MTPRRFAAPALVACALLAQAGLASPAHAATQRWASPTGTADQSCGSPASACSLDKAVDQAGAGDEVIVLPGTYQLGRTALVDASPGLDVHGSAGSAASVIVTSADQGLHLSGSGSQVSDLTIDHTGTSYGLNVFASGILVQRVDVHSTGQVACGLGYSGVVRDSLCVTSAGNGVAVDDSWNGGTGQLSLRNVTAVATGPGSYGLRADALDHDTGLVVDARNVIVSGVSADVRATQTGFHSSSNVVLHTSNYDAAEVAGGAAVTAAGTGGNQQTPPLFAETTGYTQAFGSPTVDAGLTDSLVGTTDLAGQPRRLGAAVDIGADELDPTPPDVVADRGPARRLHQRRTVVAFHSTQPATFTCALDHQAPAACGSPYRVEVRARNHGRHTLTVSCANARGVPDPTPATWTWRYVRKKHHGGHRHHHH